MNNTIVTLETVTYAMKARKLLQRHGIQTKLIKIDSQDSGTGCKHGLEISGTDYFETVKILGENGIPFSVPPSKFDILR